jgi:protein transport protein DSL1/ZW10
MSGLLLGTDERSADGFSQAKIQTINKETAQDVNTWFDNAKSVQDDINRSKTLANDILKQAEQPDVSGKTIEEAEAKAEFLIKELDYNQQVRQALLGIKGVSKTLDEVERASKDRRILDALHLLESTSQRPRSWRCEANV